MSFLKKMYRTLSASLARIKYVLRSTPKYLMLCLLILPPTSCDLAPCNASQLAGTHETVGAYNHLTLCLALVRDGLRVNSIRRDILGNVKLASLSPELQELYRSLLQICDKALVHQEKSAHTERLLNELNEQKEQAERQQEFKIISSAISSGAGGPLPFVLSLLLSEAPSDSEEMQVAADTIRAMKTAIAQEVSDFEFQLSMERSKLIQSKNALPKQLITTAEVEEYLDLDSSKNEANVYISSLELLFQRKPALYFVAYELGRQAFSEGRLTNAQGYFEAAVENAPSILNRNPIRVDAYCFIGDILTQGTEYQKALDQYSEALEEDAGSAHGLRGKAFALYHLKRYAEARRIYERCLRIKPDDVATRYNHACLLALTDAEQSLVIKELKRAFNSGFTDILHAKSDSDLASLHESQRFDELTKMRIGYDVTWNWWNRDVFSLSNRSEFDWTNVTVNISFLESTSPDWKTVIEPPGIQRKRLRKDEILSIGAFDSTIEFLKSVELNISTDQGSKRVSFQNNAGQLEVSETKTQ